MKKARDINQLANNLNPELVLTPQNKDVYVPIYDKILTVLRNIVINDEVENQVFLVAGQSGTGKTSALNFFAEPQLEKQYSIKYINMRDFLDLSDVDIIDFLLAFAFALVKDSPLEKNYYKKLIDLQKKHEGTLQETVEKETGSAGEAGVKAEIGAGIGFLDFLKLKADFFSNLKIESSYRKKTREVFKLKKPFLRDLINDLLLEYMGKSTTGKKLLVVIDDLDKLKNVDQIKSVFIENRSYITGLRCKKIISIPTHLSKAPEVNTYSPYPIRHFVHRITPNPLTKKSMENDPVKRKQELEKIDTNKQLLREIIKRRIAEDVSLIDGDAVEEAVEKSGGILRQFIRILYVAAVEVRALEGTKISLDDVRGAIALLRNNMAGTITSTDKITLLDDVDKKNIPASDDVSNKFIDLLLNNQVLVFENGDPWYEVNPLIRQTVKTYASR